MAETKMQLVDWLDDLCVRFILNLPQEELESVERLCFQIEEAQWFYEDFVRPLDPKLPTFNLRDFSLLVFKYCPILAGFDLKSYDAAYSQFLAYRSRVPVRGAILLDPSMEEVLLVKGWKKGSSWSFPRGKINKDEKDLDCAIREVYEETGFDINEAGLVKTDEEAKSIEVSMREQHLKLYVFRGVPKSTLFEPKTRKEISKIQWYRLSSLPGYTKHNHAKPANGSETLTANKLYMVAPFLPPLKKWINKLRKQDGANASQLTNDSYTSVAEGNLTDTDVNYDDVNCTKTHIQDQATRLQDPSILSTLKPSSDGLFMAPNSAAPNTAEQLKQLLKVGQSEPPAPPVNVPLPQPARPDNFPAFYHQHQNLPNMAVPRQMAPPPQSPFGQDQFNSVHYPLISHPHHVRPPPISTAGPSSGMFPIQPVQTPTHHGYAHQRMPSHHMPRAPSGMQGYGFSTQQQFGWPHGPPQSPFTPTGPQHFPTPATARPPQSPLAPIGAEHYRDGPTSRPAPYQSTGDPQFAQPGEHRAQQAPKPPAPSQLPAPKLSQQAQNLLSVFKGNGKPATPASTADMPQPKPPATQPSTMGQQNIVAIPSGPQEKPKSSVSLEPIKTMTKHDFGGLVPSTVSPTAVGGRKAPKAPKSKKPQATAKAQPEVATSKQPEASAEKQPETSANKHQDALLSLFKAPAQPKVETVPAPIRTTMTPSESRPVLAELSATRSTEKPSESQPAPVERLTTHTAKKPSQSDPGPVELSATPALGAVNLNKQPEPVKPSAVFPDLDKANGAAGKTPKILQRPVADSHKKSPALTSATVSGPENIPEHGSARRKTRRGKEQMTKAEQESRQPSIQILKRPADAPKPTDKLSSTSRPATPSHPAELAGNGAKPFQPQILKRPQSSAKSSANGSPALTHVTPQKEEAPEDPQKALLSLFGKKSEEGAGKGKETSEAQGKSMEKKELRRDSKQVMPLLSKPTTSNVPSPAVESPIARPNEPLRAPTNGAFEPFDTSEWRKHSVSSPISPADKDFLRGFLDNVVGGAHGKRG